MSSEYDPTDWQSDVKALDENVPVAIIAPRIFDDDQKAKPNKKRHISCQCERCVSGPTNAKKARTEEEETNATRTALLANNEQGLHKKIDKFAQGLQHWLEKHTDWLVSETKVQRQGFFTASVPVCILEKDEFSAGDFEEVSVAYLAFHPLSEIAFIRNRDMWQCLFAYKVCLHDPRRSCIIRVQALFGKTCRTIQLYYPRD